MTDDERAQLDAALAAYSRGEHLDPDTAAWVAEQHRTDPHARDLIGAAAEAAYQHDIDTISGRKDRTS